MRETVRLKKRLGRTPAGETVRLPSNVVRTLVAIGHAERVPTIDVTNLRASARDYQTTAVRAEEISKSRAAKPAKGAYKRRDMRAEETRAEPAARVERVGKPLPLEPVEPARVDISAASGAAEPVSTDTPAVSADNADRADEAPTTSTTPTDGAAANADE